MSIENIDDRATKNALRDLKADVNRLMAQMSTFIKTNSVLVNHSQLQGLDYASSGHTGFAATSDIPSVTELVTGPSSATDHGVALFDGTTGKLLQDTSEAPTSQAITYNPISATLSGGASFTVTAAQVQGGTGTNLTTFASTGMDIKRTNQGERMFSGLDSAEDIGFSAYTDGKLEWGPFASPLVPDVVLDRTGVGILQLTTGVLDLNSKKITSVADPTLAQDAATKAYVDGATPATPTIEQVLTAGATASTEPIFGGGASFLDSDVATFGTGDDFEIYHDGTNNYLDSNIAEGTSDQDGTRILWDIDTAQTSIVGGGANRPGGGGAQKVCSMGFTDGAAAWQEIWGFYPYQRGPVGIGPGIVTPLDNWFVGGRESSVYTGMHKGSSGLDFYHDSVLSFGGISTGLALGSVGGHAEIRTAVTGKNMRFYPSVNNTTNSQWFEMQNRFDIDAPSSGTVFFVCQQRRSAGAGGDIHLFHVWPGDTGGCGVLPDMKVSLDDGNNTQGDTYQVYDSASSKLQTWVDGTNVLELSSTTTGLPSSVALTMYDAEPARASVSEVHGGLLALATAQPLDSVPTDLVVTKGTGKVMVVINAGSDLAGSITVTGTSVNRDTGATTGADTDTITVDAATTDASDTDTNTNPRYSFTGAYITSKWFTGSVTLSTADLTLTDVDVYHVSFEQFNDAASLTLNTLDVNLYHTNTAAEFDCYLYSLQVTGDKCNIERTASVNLGADGENPGATPHYWRLRRGALAKTIDGTTDGIWVDIHYSNSPAYIEDVNMKVWATVTPA